MPEGHDDLDAVKTIVDALKDFDKKDQERVIRWAQEKLGLGSPKLTSAIGESPSAPPSDSGETQMPGTGVDIKAFVALKKPTSDNQFATVVAYYYKFAAPPKDRKDEIGSNDLKEACRLAVRPQLEDANRTLNNAHYQGLLDRGSKGHFTISTVGENLVALALPKKHGESTTVTKKIKKGKKPQSKSAKKGASKN